MALIVKPKPPLSVKVDIITLAKLLIEPSVSPPSIVLYLLAPYLLSSIPKA